MMYESLNIKGSVPLADFLFKWAELQLLKMSEKVALCELCQDVNNVLTFRRPRRLEDVGKF